MRPTKRKRFPIMDSGFSIPWAMIEPFNRQALKNHDQSLERLAERGGLDPSEALAVLEGRKWERMDDDHARSRLLAKVADYEALELPTLHAELNAKDAKLAVRMRRVENLRHVLETIIEVQRAFGGEPSVLEIDCQQALEDDNVLAALELQQ